MRLELEVAIDYWWYLNTLPLTALDCSIWMRNATFMGFTNTPVQQFNQNVNSQSGNHNTNSYWAFNHSLETMSALNKLAAPLR